MPVFYFLCCRAVWQRARRKMGPVPLACYPTAPIVLGTCAETSTAALPCSQVFHCSRHPAVSRPGRGSAPGRRGTARPLTRQGHPAAGQSLRRARQAAAARAFMLAERDKHMSEQKSFMQQLDEWTEATVIMPLADPKYEDNFDVAVDGVKRAIRQKVLESYRNGQQAGRPRVAASARQERR